MWNPWHGCRRISEGCEHCYMYFLDGKRGIDTSLVTRTSNFDLPLQKNRHGEFKLKPGMHIYVGLSTDFFVEEADEWRPEVWRMMRRRSDIAFRLLTKRAHRIRECLPADWGDGYKNVMLSVTCENQRRADERLPIRPCHYDWVKSLSDQCATYDVTFNFIETGTVFVKDNRTFHIPSKRIQSQQAHRSGLSHHNGKPEFKLIIPNDSLFGTDLYTPLFREHCATCGSRMTCNGCSGCGNC